MKYEILEQRAINLQKKMHSNRMYAIKVRLAGDEEKQAIAQQIKWREKLNNYLDTAKLDHNKERELLEELKKIGWGWD